MSQKKNRPMRELEKIQVPCSKGRKKIEEETREEEQEDRGGGLKEGRAEIQEG
jgi:hypothetical protein